MRIAYNSFTFILFIWTDEKQQKYKLQSRLVKSLSILESLTTTFLNTIWWSLHTERTHNTNKQVSMEHWKLIDRSFCVGNICNLVHTKCVIRLVQWSMSLNIIQESSEIWYWMCNSKTAYVCSQNFKIHLNRSQYFAN